MQTTATTQTTVTTGTVQTTGSTAEITQTTGSAASTNQTAITTAQATTAPETPSKPISGGCGGSVSKGAEPMLFGGAVTAILGAAAGGKCFGKKGKRDSEE